MLEPKATARKSHLKDEEVGRSDPRPRRFEASHDGVKVKNRDPSKHYVGVNTPQIEEYAENGYIIEVVRKGGPMFGIGLTAKDGDPVSYRGHILMSIDKAEMKRQESEGSLDGLGKGQQWADEVEERILMRNGQDPLRGIGNYVQVDKHDPQYEITAPRPEIGI